MTKPRKLVSFDWAIKRLLRSKANFDILEGFLSELLKDDIKILSILESESNKDFSRQKTHRLDLKVANGKNEIIIIEIQYEHEYDYFQRILFSASMAVTEHLAESSAYSEVVKVISINILYFDLGHGADYIYRGQTVFTGLHRHDELMLSNEQRRLYRQASPREIFPEYYLIKVNNFDNVARNTLDEWIYFLKNEEIKPGFKARGLQQAKTRLDIMKLSDAERIEYRRYSNDLHYQASMVESSYGLGKLEGREEGREEGKAEGKARLILQLFCEGEITLEKAEAKLAALQSDCPAASFWPEIFAGLRKTSPGCLKEEATRYKTSSKSRTTQVRRLAKKKT